jgi:hypothetical protein
MPARITLEKVVTSHVPTRRAAEDRALEEEIPMRMTR